MDVNSSPDSDRNFFAVFFWDKYFSLGFALGLTLQPWEILDLMFFTPSSDTVESENFQSEEEQFGWDDLYRSSFFLFFLTSWFIIGTFAYLRTIDILLKLIFIVVDTKYDIQLAAINEALFGLWFAGKIVTSWMTFQGTSSCISRHDCTTPFFTLLTTLTDSACNSGPEYATCGVFSSNEILEPYCPAIAFEPEAISSCQHIFQQYGPGISISVLSGSIVSLFYFLFNADKEAAPEES